LTEDKWILRMIVGTLCASVMVVVLALISGLFVKDIDNASIFKIIGPVFQSVSGGLLVLLTQMLGKK
jgi:hypothetical protein